jgi:transketolase
MTHVALEAAGNLASAGVSAKVVNIGTVKPLNVEAVVEAASQCRAVIVAEEHSVIGGLGGAILEAMAGRCERPVRLVGIQDAFGQSASSWDELLGAYGLTAAAVATAATESLARAK